MITKTQQLLGLAHILFTPPNLSDEDQIQTGRLLTAYLLVFMTIVTIGCLILIMISPRYALRLTGIMVAIDSLYLILYVLTQRGWVRTANILTIAGSWLLLTGTLMTGGGLHSASFAGYFMITFLAGITLGGRAMCTVAIFSGIAGFTMAYLETIGILPTAAYHFFPYKFWGIQTIVLIMLALLQYYASWIVKGALQKAKAELTERKRAEAEIHYRQKLLEKVIAAGKNITSITEMERCLFEIHQNVVLNLGFDRVGLFLYNADNDFIHGCYGTNRNGQSERNTWYSKHINEWGDWQVALQNPCGISIVEDYQSVHNPEADDEMYGVKQHVTLAAWAGDKPVALITVDNLISQKRITPADIEALQLFAGYAGLAIENVRMHSGLETLVEERTDALKQSQNSLELFLDTANDLIQSLNENGEYIYVNQSWCNILGYSSEEAKEMNMLQVVDREYQEHCLKIFHSLMVDGTSQIIEVGFRTRQGQLVIVEGSISVQMRNDGERVTNGFFRDITERKRAEIAMRQANLKMEQALRMKDEFLANMSHELRTPLNAILGLSESLIEETVGPLNPRQNKYLNTVNESGRHLLELINDILDLAKIESGQIHLEINSVNVRQVCKASLTLVEQLAKKKSQKIELNVAHGINTVHADERRLKQMIVNLLSNAIKFTPENGKIGITVTTDIPGTKLYIEVWDTGIGIREKDMGSLFQPFVQLDAGLSRESSGTGLGLALVAQMAHLHGGNVVVTSEFEKGSRFTLTLPWAPTHKNISNDILSGDIGL